MECPNFPPALPTALGRRLRYNGRSLLTRNFAGLRLLCLSLLKSCCSRFI
jgi:hypothetical protein